MKTEIKRIEEVLTRPLASNEIKYRVQSCGTTNGRNWATLVSYIDARTAISRLNEAFGLFGWQNEIEEFKDGIKSVLKIRNPETGEWVSKEDVGTDSNVEALKGSVSDALKRACVLLGIGIELYETKTIYARECNKNDTGALYCKTKDGTVFYVLPDVKKPDVQKIELHNQEQPLILVTKKDEDKLLNEYEYINENGEDKKVVVIVKGNSYKIKDELKKLGYRFDKDTKTWYIETTQIELNRQKFAALKTDCYLEILDYEDDK